MARGTMRTNAAAAMLGVSPNTLRSWERRFGFPTPRRTTGGHRQFDVGELEALRQALEETQNVSSAIGLARERGTGPASPSRLRAALVRYDEPRADRVLEESLAVRSVERTVDEVLLPGVESLARHGEEATPELGFAWRWAGDWLAAAVRVAPAPTRDEAVLIFDASGPLDLDALHARALELGLRRAGLRTLTLTADVHPGRTTRALRVLAPRSVVLTGARASLDMLGRLVYAARRATPVGGPEVDVLDFRGALPEVGASTVPRLGSSALAARDALLAHLQGRRDLEEMPTGGARGAGVVRRAP